MEQSKIYAAFVKAQRAFGPALKTHTNPHFKSKYADLSACIEAVIDSLNQHGIGLVQRTRECESGVAIETVFVHESGESMSSGILRVPASKQDAQGYGSAMTYARRYSIMAACGIAPEDDDGNAASAPKKEPAPRLPKLTDEEAAHEYNKWEQVKSILVDEDGDPDQERIVEEWKKLPSNVRSAIKAHGEAMKSQKSLHQEAMNTQHA